MILFDKVRENAEGLRRMGERALDEAGRAGVPAYYMDPAYGEDIIREFPTDVANASTVDKMAPSAPSNPGNDAPRPYPKLAQPGRA